ncbi:copper chaperone PCu(A)C [Rubritepida flocculans]|uniref:copper chaperone PCu(A)C n=1 Tax=Rubritepida flocculans TaxID=182403 RepID=UPI0004112EC2|nr:copper chaperone PCu(A)C [Rubritepida flocculans]
MISRRTLAGAALMLAALPLRPALAQTIEAGALRLENPWTRAANQGAQGAGFLVIRNTAAEPDRLLAASSPAAQRMELHTHIREGEVMRMRPVNDIPVPGNGSVSLQPGGLHLMLIGLTQPLVAGQSVPVTLRFERAGEVTIQLAVQAAGARQMQMGQGHRH